MTPKLHSLLATVSKEYPVLGTILQEIVTEIESQQELTIASGSSLKAIDQTKDKATRKILILDDKNLIQLGPEAAASGDFHIAIPNVDNPPPVATNFTRDGILLINKTTKELCYYTGKARYKIAGAAF